MFGPHVGSLHVDVFDLNPSFIKSTRLLTISQDQRNIWHRASRPLPKLEYMYVLNRTIHKYIQWKNSSNFDIIK